MFFWIDLHFLSNPINQSDFYCVLIQIPSLAPSIFPCEICMTALRLVTIFCECVGVGIEIAAFKMEVVIFEKKTIVIFRNMEVASKTVQKLN